MPVKFALCNDCIVKIPEDRRDKSVSVGVSCLSLVSFVVEPEMYSYEK